MRVESIEVYGSEDWSDEEKALQRRIEASKPCLTDREWETWESFPERTRDLMFERLQFLQCYPQFTDFDAFDGSDERVIRRALAVGPQKTLQEMAGYMAARGWNDAAR